MIANKPISYLLGCLILMVLSYPLSGQDIPDTGAGIEAPEFERVGGTGFQFLKLPTDARYAAMGNVITSPSRGYANAALANPASIADVKNLSANFMRMDWIADIDAFTGAVVKNFGSLGNIGITFMYVDYGTMIESRFEPIFDDQGNYTFNVEQAFDIGTFSANNLAIGLSYARNVTDRLQFGVNFKYVSEEIADASTENFVIDVGTVYYTGLKSFRIAMLGRNFGPDTEFLKFDERVAVQTAKVKMPMSFVLGGAYDILEINDTSPFLWTVAAEFIHTNDASEKVHVGTEFSILDFVMLRGGYRFNYDEEDITLGAGIRVHTGDTFVTINYAYVDFGRLDKVNMFSVAFGL